jgi:transposase, IS30 family
MIEVLQMVRPRVSLQRRRVFWRLVAEGVPPGVAGRGVDVASGTGEAWFSEAGGMAPIRLSEPSGRFLSPLEREEIALGLARGRSVRAIAAGIGRSPSTVSREVARNRTSRQGYRAVWAQHQAERRAARPKPTRLGGSPQLRARVQAGLRLRWSPRQISQVLRRRYPSQPEMWVSHESIYQGLYVQGRGELRRELARCLRTGRALRRPRKRTQGETRGHIPDMVMISDRPAEAADRAVPGHWEGDLILGANNASAIGTLVERSTRYCLLLHLPGRHGAQEVRDQMLAAMGRLPRQLWRSLTWDQGAEMSAHTQITAASGLDIYFCDPASPWQRGSNENTNGLLRQYFPKGSDLSVHDPDHLDFVAGQLNGRPRETLDWATPTQALQALLSQDLPTGVATTD